LTRERIVRGLALAHLAGAAGIGHFWVGFSLGILLPRDVLERKFPFVDAYYSFEEAFTVPDLTTALVCTVAAARLRLDPRDRTARIVLTGASGVLMFLATLDVSYDLRNGMYGLGSTSLDLLAVPLLGLLGVATIALLVRCRLTPADASPGTIIV
jgi:hypothetical protein